MKDFVCTASLLFLVFWNIPAFGQVSVVVPDLLEQSTEKHISANQKCDGKMEGYSVQLCFESGTNSRERAEAIRMRFLSKHSKVSATVSFKEPNFRVRVGDFRTRAEARGFREVILNDFPQCFVIKDIVQYPQHGSEQFKIDK